VAPPKAQSAAAPARRHYGIDAEFVQLAAAVPGFGGYSFDDQGRAVVFLTDTTTAAARVAALRGLIGTRDARFAQSPLVVRKGEYDFTQLAAWKDTLFLVLPSVMAGITSVDADEARNRVRVGVVDPAALRPRVLQAVATLGIPAAALIVERRGPFVIAAAGDSLTSVWRPTVNGLQIRNSNGNLCTLGYNTYLEETRAQGIKYGVTNSHCTNVTGSFDGAGGTENTAFYQSGGPRNTPVVGSHYIGTEQRDPEWTTAPWSENPNRTCGTSQATGRAYRCRASDAAFFRYDVASNAQVGKIARPAGGANSGRLDIDRANPTFTVFGALTEPLGMATNYKLNKVGVVTGWTSGNVESTCEDFLQYLPGEIEQGTKLYCQATFSSRLSQNDSGSPVFYLTSSGAAQLYGIMWGGGFNAEGIQVAAFSPMTNITAELGGVYGY
jgi:hypothetical protein